MPNQAERLAHLVKTDHAAWCADPTGTITCQGGPAVDRVLRERPGFRLPTTVWELYLGRPDLTRLFTDALKGKPHPPTVAEWNGKLWEATMQTIVHGGQIVGVQCTAFILEPAPMPAKPIAPAPAPGCAIYAAAGDHVGYGVESGDQFLLRDGVRGVTLVRQWSAAVWQEYLSEDPSRVHLTHDGRSTSASAPPPLRILRD